MAEGRQPPAFFVGGEGTVPPQNFFQFFFDFFIFFRIV